MHANTINVKIKVYIYYFGNLIKAKKLETKNVLINWKNYKDMTILLDMFKKKSITMLSLHDHE